MFKASAFLALLHWSSAAPQLPLSIRRPTSVEGTANALEADGGDLRHPLPFEKDHTDTTAEISTAEGVLISADLASAPELSSPGQPQSLFLQLFTLSYASPYDVVEQWLRETGVARPHAPLRFTALFDSFLAQSEPKGLTRDEHGDVCIGLLLKAELCLQAMGCVPITAEQPANLDLWLPVPVATNYRLESYMSADPCHPASEAPLASVHGLATGARRLQRLAEAPQGAFEGEFLLLPRTPVASGHLRFRTLYVDEASSWWAEKSGGETALVPTQCWMDMMGTSLLAAEGWLTNRNALYLEFGVANGRSLAFISSRLQKQSHVKIHAFDSFQGIPQGWHRYQKQSFGMDGEPPDLVKSLQNVELHVGYFTQTLRELDRFRSFPVAFAHIDSDLFASAREVLAYLHCQLVPGTVLVFDEWFNYEGWQKGGEFRAWNLFAESYGVRWRPLGLHFEQAVPIVVESLPEGCYLSDGKEEL